LPLPDGPMITRSFMDELELGSLPQPHRAPSPSRHLTGRHPRPQGRLLRLLV